MAKLKIRAYTGGKTEPDKTFTIPLNVLDVAARLIPKDAAAHLRREGIDLEEIAQISGSPDVRGILLEAEDHIENKKVVISIE